MWVLETIAVAFSLYSALPMPQFDWNERNMRYALLAFPLVGAVQALVWWGVCALSLPPLLRGALLCVLPVLLTGGIHLDGYADVSDALASHAAPERRQQILRDPHVGAFAVIWLCSYFVASFALCASFRPTDALLRGVGLGFVLSRALSGLLLTCLPIAEGSSLAKLFAGAAARRRVQRALAALIAACLAAAGVLCGWVVLLLIAAVCCASVWRCVYAATRSFGGTSGDLAGWFLVKTEVWLLAALVAAQYGGLVP